MTASLYGDGNDAEGNKQIKNVCRRERGELLAHRAGHIPQIFAWPTCSSFRSVVTCLLPSKAFSDHPLSIATLTRTAGNLTLHLFFFPSLYFSLQQWSLSKCQILYLFILFFICLLSLGNKLHKIRDRQYLEQHLQHGRYSINIRWINKKIVVSLMAQIKLPGINCSQKYLLKIM